MRHDDIDYNAIQRRVTERVQRRYRFFLHTAVFIVGIPIIGQWNLSWLFLLWGLAWVGHLLQVSYYYHLEKAIAAEVEREQQRLQKRKRHEIAPPEHVYETATRLAEHDDPDTYASKQRSPYPPDESNGHGYPDWLGDDGEFRDYEDYSDSRR
jgi:hypothetical protein